MENDPHLVNLLTSLGALHGRENVARIAGVLADPGPIRALADAADEVVRHYDAGTLDRSGGPAVERLRALLYGPELEEAAGG